MSPLNTTASLRPSATRSPAADTQDKSTARLQATHVAEVRNKSCRSRNAPSRHINHADSGRNFPYPQEDCSSTFNIRSLLINHQRTQSPEGPFRCEEEGCKKEFSTKGNLKRHKAVHSSDRPFRCEEEGCKKEFSTKGNLKQHKMTVHSLEKPFRCEEEGCTYSCKRKDQLKQHKMMHSLDSPLPCEAEGCQEIFNRKDHLKEHKIWAHSSLPPKECPEKSCGRKFKYQRNLTTHWKQKHAGQPVPVRQEKPSQNAHSADAHQPGQHLVPPRSTRQILEATTASQADPAQMAQQPETTPPVSAAGYPAPASQAGEVRSTEPDSRSANPDQTRPGFEQFHNLSRFDLAQQASFAAWQARLAETWQEPGSQVVEILDDDSALDVAMDIAMDLEALISRRQEPGWHAMETPDHAMEILDDASAIKIALSLDGPDFEENRSPLREQGMTGVVC